jgi:hypothetical protein
MRTIVISTAAYLLSAFVCFGVMAADTPSTVASEREYRLKFYHTHTGERLDIVYRVGDHYILPQSRRLITICATTAQATSRISTHACSISCQI